jgi:hypothetical protein
MRSKGSSVWLAALAAAGLTASASRAESCLSSAQVVDKASPSKRVYSYPSPGRAIDARGVSWLDIPDHALDLDGSALGCWVGGRIDGPYPENAYYECTSEHGYTGGGPCWDYHTTAAMAPDDGPRIIEDVHIKDYGDGISVEARSGDIIGRRLWFENIHDDAMESDYAQASLSCEDCLFERANMILAFDRRSSADGNTPKPGWSGELRNSLVQLHRFTNTYKQKPGHGSVIKDDPDVSPVFRFTDNVFLLGPVSGSGQVQFPFIGYTEECRNNTLLWQGSLSAYQDMLDEGESSDGATNGERLTWLNQRFPNCYSVIVKPASQSAAEFRAQRWDPLVARWKATHAAAGGAPSPDPDPVPDPEPDPDPTPEPDPDPEPDPEPEPDPTPEPEPEPDPGPDPEPTPDPGPGPGSPPQEPILLP